VEEFLKFLDYFWNKYEATYENTEGLKFFDKRRCNRKDYDRLEAYCWHYLIKAQYWYLGENWNLVNTKILRKNNYICYAADEDSLGLRVACIVKDEKNFSFKLVEN
jgi:hypothetical protein